MNGDGEIALMYEVSGLTLTSEIGLGEEWP